VGHATKEYIDYLASKGELDALAMFLEDEGQRMAQQTRNYGWSVWSDARDEATWRD